ncbi:MAG TPA: ankyrin repeat domain-containing protein [Fimbriimonas sp.]|nr:ankyrin repeat domain-containing protein [Fimbriimonas sp.]
MVTSEVRQDLHTLRRRAKEIARKARDGDLKSLEFLSTHAPAVKPGSLAVAQLAVARSLRFESWARLKKSMEPEELKRLFRAVGDGQVQTAREILRDFPHFARATDEHGQTLLVAGVYSNDAKMAQMLVRNGAPAGNTIESSAHTAMSWAVTISSLEYARGLSLAGLTPDLFCAAGLGDLRRVREFWSDGHLQPNPSRTGSSRIGPGGERLPRPPADDADQVSDALYIACRQGHGDVAGFLLEHGADPNFRAYMGATCLHWAEFSGDQELSDRLRAAGGSDELEDYGWKAHPKAFAPICWAGFGMVWRLKPWLEIHPEAVQAQGRFGTPLHAAAWERQLGSAQILVEKGADVSVRNEAGATPLDIARQREFPEMIAFLEGLDNGTEVPHASN